MLFSGRVTSLSGQLSGAVYRWRSETQEALENICIGCRTTLRSFSVVQAAESLKFCATFLAKLDRWAFTPTAIVNFVLTLRPFPFWHVTSSGRPGTRTPVRIMKFKWKPVLMGVDSHELTSRQEMNKSVSPPTPHKTKTNKKQLTSVSSNSPFDLHDPEMLHRSFRKQHSHIFCLPRRRVYRRALIV